MRELVEQASDAVREGVSLARSLSAQKHFPPMLIHMIRAGEITGELPAMLDRAAAAQEADLERRTLTIAGLLEPALILAMGVVVLLIVLAPSISRERSASRRILSAAWLTACATWRTSSAVSLTNCSP